MYIPYRSAMKETNWKLISNNDIVVVGALKKNRKEVEVEKVVVVQAEATSTGANTIGIVEIH